MNQKMKEILIEDIEKADKLDLLMIELQTMQVVCQNLANRLKKLQNFAYEEVKLTERDEMAVAEIMKRFE